jgi:hypothetical protein
LEFLERTSRPEAGRPPYPYLSFCELTSLVAAGEEGREVLERDKAKHSAW